jgi:hypothetical protein
MNLKTQATQPLEPSYRIIKLTQGQVCKVDLADFEWLSQWRWYARWNDHTQSFYAARQSKYIDGKQHTIWMHREIMQAPKGMYVDHIFHDTLDNRRSKLRLATHSQNHGNISKLRRNNTSGVRGVYQVGTTNRFKAVIWDGRGRNGKQLHLGTYNSIEAASKAYEDKAREIRGEFYAPPSPKKG